MPHLLRLFCITILGSLFTPSILVAQSTSTNQNPCSDVWAPYTKALSELPRSSNHSYHVLFSGPDGEIYNCLGISLPDPEAMNNLILMSRSKAHVKAQLTAGEPCYISINAPRQSPFLLVHLPYNQDGLQTPVCSSMPSWLLQAMLDQIAALLPKQ